MKVYHAMTAKISCDMITNTETAGIVQLWSIIHVVNLLNTGFYIKFMPGVYISVLYNYTSVTV